MYHGMENNVAGESFPFQRTKNPFSIFRAQKTGRFVKQPPNDSFRMVSPHFVKILYHITCTMPQPGYLKPFRSPWQKRQIPAESGGSGSGLNYKYMIRCSCFLEKMSFRLT